MTSDFIPSHIQARMNATPDGAFDAIHEVDIEDARRAQKRARGYMALIAAPLLAALYVLLFLTICDYAALAWRSLCANVAG